MARRIGRKSRRAPASGRNAPGELSPQLLERIKTDFNNQGAPGSFYTYVPANEEP